MMTTEQIMDMIRVAVDRMDRNTKERWTELYKDTTGLNILKITGKKAIWNAASKLIYIGNDTNEIGTLNSMVNILDTIFLTYAGLHRTSKFSSNEFASVITEVCKDYCTTDTAWMLKPEIKIASAIEYVEKIESALELIPAIVDVKNELIFDILFKRYISLTLPSVLNIVKIAYNQDDNIYHLYMGAYRALALMHDSTIWEDRDELFTLVEQGVVNDNVKWPDMYNYLENQLENN